MIQHHHSKPQLMLPFDAHNHIHMGPSPAAVAIQDDTSRLGGVAIMSTHPRDFDKVLHLSQHLPLQQQMRQDDNDEAQESPLLVVPGLGVHPWWLADLTDQDWQLCPEHDNQPQWIHDMETLLLQNPNAIVGEIGLDGFHFNAETGELACPMDKQVEALQWQLQIAARLQRPVSIHTVQCMGPLLQLLTKLKKQDQLPTSMYFHAFGGKAGTVNQLLALCGGKARQVYFGFAPVINFRSPKTAQVMQKVGLERMVLETDHEDAALVQPSMRQGIAYIAQTLGVDEATVIETTTKNALDLYGLS